MPVLPQATFTMSVRLRDWIDGVGPVVAMHCRCRVWPIAIMWPVAVCGKCRTKPRPLGEPL